jgi:hypothetical protein
MVHESFMQRVSFYPPLAHLCYLAVSGARYLWHIHKDRSRRTKSLILSSQGRADGLGTSLGEEPPTDSPHCWCGCHATHMDPDHNTILCGVKLCVMYAHIITMMPSFFAHVQHIRYGAQIQLYIISCNHI